jgi:glycerol-3-phosphate O-acyltransferase
MSTLGDWLSKLDLSRVRGFAPAAVLAKIAAPMLERLPVDPAWEARVRIATERGAVVHVVRNASVVDYLALDHVLRRAGLPSIGFVNDVGGFPIARKLGSALPTRAPETIELGDALDRGESALLFMKGAPSMLDRAAAHPRGRSEGSPLLRTLLVRERDGRGPITLLPHFFVWTQRAEKLRFSLFDTVFGPADFPGDARAAMQFLAHHRNASIRVGESMLVADAVTAEAPTDETRVQRVTYALLRRLERERRAVVGPAEKPVDRVREEVLRSPKLQSILRDLSGPGVESRAALVDKARGMLRELEATPDPQTIQGLELLMDSLVDKLYAGIEIDGEGLERVRAALRKGTVVLLPSHKSHVDYLLLSFVFRKNALPAPMIAAGDNLSFFPLGAIFRRSGAFFIRRSFRGDRLYTAVVDAYVRRLIRDGFTLEFFLEGGRSRTGKLLSPKLGLLNMVIDAALGIENREVFFVPVSIGYERMMEEGTYAQELSGAKKRKEDVTALLKVGSVLREKYGRANVQFGEILELSAVCERTGVRRGPDAEVTPAKRRALVSRIAHQAMSEINRVTAVTPGSLVALVLLCHGGRAMPHIELVERCRRLGAMVRRLGARTAPSLMGEDGTVRPEAIREALAVYVRGGLVRQHVPGDTLTSKARKQDRIYAGDDVLYSIPSERRLLLDIAKNIIVHLFVDRGLVSVALLASPGPPLARAELCERVRSLSRLFKFEFMFRADAPFEVIFDEVTNAMQAEGELAFVDGRMSFGGGHDGVDGRAWITFYAAVVRNFLEGYRVAARAARSLVKGPLAQKELCAKALRLGEQMYMAGEIERSEAVCQPLIENAFTAFVDQGYLVRTDGKLTLAPSFASDSTSLAIEARITGYLLRRSGDPSW